ncbi:hypothetical protein [Oceanobacillus sp. J11TS1]|uniref:hypothetical protein n=1 Tax=Oceanobacillus sp. J11TS1 TaxID=2807191 RepID=UPI001BB44261|nr:hypothetical protein [Oceanobacillus sp. J11TS1]
MPKARRHDVNRSSIVPEYAIVIDGKTAHSVDYRSSCSINFSDANLDEEPRNTIKRLSLYKTISTTNNKMG